jgi:hypothetical protein
MLTGTDTTEKWVYITHPSGVHIGKVFTSEKEAFEGLKAIPAVGVVRAKNRTDRQVELVVYK